MDFVIDAAPAAFALVGLRPRTISFCGAVPWWKWCRPLKRSGKIIGWIGK